MIMTCDKVDRNSYYLIKELNKFKCPCCASSLIVINKLKLLGKNRILPRWNAELYCESCHTKFKNNHITFSVLRIYLSGLHNLSDKQISDLFLFICPVCGEETAVLNDEKCLECINNDAPKCEICNDILSEDELAGYGLCRWCSSKLNEEYYSLIEFDRCDNDGWDKL